MFSIIDILTLAIVISGIFVITSVSPVVAIVFLISTFVFSALYLIIINISFIGLSYLIVYVGAIAVLFLFVVIILNIRTSEIASVGLEYTSGLPLGFVVGTIFILEILSVLPALTHNFYNIFLSIFNNINAYILNISFNQVSVNISFNIGWVDIWYITTSQIQVLGQCLYLYGIIWLLISGIILLLAILGPISLCLPRRQS